MPMPFELRMKIEGRTDVVLHGEFADMEKALLQRYLEQYEQLAQSKPLRDGFPCRSSVLVDKVQAIQNVAALVAVILGKSESLEFQIPNSETTI